VAKETKKVIFSPEEDSSVFCRALKQDGWEYKGNKMMIVMLFERETPDPPAEEVPSQPTLAEAAEIIRELLAGQPNRIYWEPVKKKAKEFLARLEGKTPSAPSAEPSNGDSTKIDMNKLCSCGHAYWKHTILRSGGACEAGCGCKCRKFESAPEGKDWLDPGPPHELRPAGSKSHPTPTELNNSYPDDDKPKTSDPPAEHHVCEKKCFYCGNTMPPNSSRCTACNQVS
jgi:hypothetical protein